MYAIIDSTGNVTNIVEADGSMADPMGWVAVPAGVQVGIGYTYDVANHSWTPPVVADPDPSEAPSADLVAAQATLNAVLDPGAPTPSQSEIIQALTTVVVSGMD